MNLTNLCRSLGIAILLMGAGVTYASQPTDKLVGNYRLHLYFGDTTPYLDDFKIELNW